MIEVPGCRILVKPMKLEEQDKLYARAEAAGIKLPEAERRKMETTVDKGTVLQIGPQAANEYIQGVEVGSLIGFTKFGGKFVRDIDSEEDLLIINDEDVICIFKENKND